MGRRERNKAEKRERIADAARALFAERGFERTTVRAIAERAGVGTGTVLLYGASKAELLLGLWVEELGAAIERQSATLPPDAALVDDLVHLFRGFFETYAANPELSRVYVKETLFLGPEQSKVYDELTARFLALLTARVGHHAASLRPDVDPATTATAAFGLYLLHVSLFLRAPTDPETAVAALRELLARFLAPLRGDGPT